MYPSSGHARAALAMAALRFRPARIPPETHVVEVLERAFFPAKLTIVAGDILRIVNRDGVPHTFTAEDGSYDSGRLRAGEIRLLPLTKVGGHRFHCALANHRVHVLVEADQSRRVPR